MCRYPPVGCRVARDWTAEGGARPSKGYAVVQLRSALDAQSQELSNAQAQAATAERTSRALREELASLRQDHLNVLSQKDAHDVERELRIALGEHKATKKECGMLRKRCDSAAQYKLQTVGLLKRYAPANHPRARPAV